MKIKNIFLIVFLLFLALSCSKEKKERVAYTDIESYKIIKDYSIRRGYKGRVEFFNNKPVTLGRKNNQYHVYFYTKDLKKTKKFSINLGKGPGEIAAPYDMEIHKKKFYILDDYLKRINVYDLDGNLVNDIVLNKNISYIGGDMKVDGRYIYLTTTRNYKFIVYDMRDNKIIQKIKHKNPLYDSKDEKVEYKGKKVYQGSLEKFGSKIYYGRYSIPYTLEVYNNNLEKTNSYVDKSYNSKYNDYKYGKDFIVGDIMINSIDLHSNNLYLSYGGISSKDKNLEQPYFISVIDKNNIDKIKKIRIKQLKKINGLAAIIGVNSQYIYLFYNKYRSKIKDYITTNSDIKGGYTAILKIKNPIEEF
ncbi:MAG: hypothetical protein FXF47_08850 [Candidatus Mcinerneyibacterium aminivorans]|uniref:6-bladed beta-propeller n=1 Tax=Candidatus Mcinerneyibacterium aminivorans TaxID=2703815 RepID=A0A5D0M9R1_9BACT|nr:MAG: hypothetical protein FXF47_08850 [Candidatus Mcinerneyibacterium aminivorans]